MKYTVISTETENKIASVEHAVEASGVVWNLSLLDEAGKETKSTLPGAEVIVDGGVLKVALPTGARFTYPAWRQSSDGSLVISTALGNFKLLALRGAGLGAAGSGAGGAKAIKSSMPGKVLKILCKPGDVVEAGQPLLIIEAMKMENEIRSPQQGKVEELAVQPGQTIETGGLLVKLGKVE